MSVSIAFNPFTGTFDYVTVIPSFAAVTPTIIHAGVTYSIAAEQQLLYNRPIQIDGVLHNDGVLVSV